MQSFAETGEVLSLSWPLWQHRAFRQADKQVAHFWIWNLGADILDLSELLADLLPLQKAQKTGASKNIPKS